MEVHHGLNDLDYAVLGIVLLSGLLALMRGFTREMFSLIAWAGAYLAATNLYKLGLPTAHHFIKNDKEAEWVAMAGVFVIALIILIIIGHLICGLIKGRTMTTIDRSLGFLYGVARGALVVSLIYLAVVSSYWPDINSPPPPPVPPDQQQQAPSPPPDWLIQAKTRPMLDYGAQKVKVLVPRDLIEKALKNTDDTLNANQKAAKQKILDTLSTPAPPEPTQERQQ